MTNSQLIDSFEEAWNKNVSSTETFTAPDIQRGDVIKVNRSVSQGMIRLRSRRMYVCWRDFGDNPNNAVFVLVDRGGEKMLSPWSGSNQVGLSRQNYKKLMSEGYIEKSFAVLPNTPEYKL